MTNTSNSARLDQYDDPDAAICLNCPLDLCVHDEPNGSHARCPRLDRGKNGHVHCGYTTAGYMSLTAACKHLRVGARTLRQWMRADGVVPERTGHTQKSLVLIPEDWVKEKQR